MPRINTQVSEQILLHQNSEKLLSYEGDEGYISSNIVIRQVSWFRGWFQRHKAPSRIINTYNVQKQIRGVKMSPTCLQLIMTMEEWMTVIWTQIYSHSCHRVNYNWNIKKCTITHNTLSPYNIVLHVSVHQNHHQAPLLKKFKNHKSICNML
jgi:hypothetical protein